MYSVKLTSLLLFFCTSRLSDKAHSVIKEAGHVTLEPVTNNGNLYEMLCIFGFFFMSGIGQTTSKTSNL